MAATPQVRLLVWTCEESPCGVEGWSAERAPKTVTPRADLSRDRGMVYGSASHTHSRIENSLADLHNVVGECKAMPTTMASLAQLAEHALRKRMVVGSVPTGGLPWLPRRAKAGL